MMRRLLLLLSLPLLLHARKALYQPEAVAEEGPWLTGPLLTPSGHVIPLGHQNYEQYLYWTSNSGVYNNHWKYVRVSPALKIFLSQTVLQFGILPRVELDLLAQFNYNNAGGQHAWHISDQPIAIGIQLIESKPGEWYPAIKVRFGVIIPLGNYNRLDPKKFATDISGGGNWAPNIAFVTSKLFNFGKGHYLAWRTSWGYTVPVPVSVHGLSLYGGAPAIGPYKATNGTVYPGNIFVALQGFEYTLSRHWALAFDIQYYHSNKTRFSGKSPPGTKPVAPSCEQFSLAPAIEYNFNLNIGVIAGPYFSIAGRNDNLADAFLGWAFAINIYN